MSSFPFIVRARLPEPPLSPRVELDGRVKLEQAAELAEELKASRGGFATGGTRAGGGGHAAPQGIHLGRVELDVGGLRNATSVESLRRITHTFLDAYYSGRYPVEESGDSSVFIDRDGRLFEHVLEYLRDDVVTEWQEDAGTTDMGLLRRMKREFGFYSVEVAAEKGPAAGEGMAFVVGGENTECRGKINRGALRRCHRHVE